MFERGKAKKQADVMSGFILHFKGNIWKGSVTYSKSNDNDWDNRRCKYPRKFFLVHYEVFEVSEEFNSKLVKIVQYESYLGEFTAIDV